MDAGRVRGAGHAGSLRGAVVSGGRSMLIMWNLLCFVHAAKVFTFVAPLLDMW